MPLEHVKRGYSEVQRCVVLVTRAPTNCLRPLKGIEQQQVCLRPSAESAAPRVESQCRSVATGSEKVAEQFTHA
jgi:hypothetical protein